MFYCLTFSSKPTDDWRRFNSGTMAKNYRMTVHIESSGRIRIGNVWKEWVMRILGRTHNKNSPISSDPKITFSITSSWTTRTVTYFSRWWQNIINWILKLNYPRAIGWEIKTNSELISLKLGLVDISMNEGSTMRKIRYRNWNTFSIVFGPYDTDDWSDTDMTPHQISLIFLLILLNVPLFPQSSVIPTANWERLSLHSWTLPIIIIERLATLSKWTIIPRLQYQKRKHIKWQIYNFGHLRVWDLSHHFQSLISRNMCYYTARCSSDTLFETYLLKCRMSIQKVLQKNDTERLNLQSDLVECQEWIQEVEIFDEDHDQRKAMAMLHWNKVFLSPLFHS